MTYFTAANPGIDMGGFFGESKSDILRKVPDKYIPRTIYFDVNATVKHIIKEMHHAGISFPVICKPDKGEMGYKVSKVTSEADLELYLNSNTGQLIIQEFITYPVELGILYYRFPDQTRSGITSIALKKFLNVNGNGKNTVEELLQNSHRGRFQITRLRKERFNLLQIVPAENQNIIVEPIGNHCKGTEFINANHLINAKLIKVFDHIISQVDGVYFGRIDLKVSSLEDLYEGRNIAIMEINGVTSEPAHIYGKGMHLGIVYRDIFSNMKIVYTISKMNRAAGISTVSVQDLIRISRNHFRTKKKH